jgi:hypothetical protein
MHMTCFLLLLCNKKDFKCFKETISRKFTDVLHCMVAMSKSYIQSKDPNFCNVHSRITNDQRMFPHFKDDIGAIDGSHINANPQKRLYYIYWKVW